MQQNDDEQNKKPPIEMTTDETFESLFGTELADELRCEASKIPEPWRPDET